MSLTAVGRSIDVGLAADPASCTSTAHGSSRPEPVGSENSNETCRLRAASSAFFG